MRKIFSLITFTVLSGIIYAQLPTSFDLRSVNGESYVTGVRNQQGGTCWAHGTMASLEGNLLISGAWQQTNEGGKPNLAEYHLDWWNGFNPFSNTDGGDGLTVHQGGDYRVATAYFSRGDGAVRDIDGQSYSTPPPLYLEYYHRYYPRTVEWFTMDSNLNGIDLIKERIMSNGVMATCIFAGATFYDGSSHYQPPTDTNLPNHSVAIVGWNDFIVTQAPQIGAWLAKNSWGAGWGLGGYFWISYYDKWACREPDMGAVSFSEVEPYKYNQVYHHDFHGWRDTKPNTTEAFNAFEAVDNDYLQGISFYVSEHDVDYTIKIYDDYAGGVLQNELSSITGNVLYRGFQTVDLINPVELTQGDDFYIYLNLSIGGMPYDRTSEVPILLGGTTKTIVSSTANPEESYYKEGGVWKDLYNYNDPSGYQNTGNFCIKGLSNNAAYGLGVNLLEIQDTGGNNDGMIDPGETVDVVLSVHNEGIFNTENINAIYSTSDPYVTINSSEINIGAIAPTDTATGIINISVNELAENGHIITGTLQTTYTSNGNSFNQDIDLYLIVGGLFEDFESSDFSSFQWENEGDANWFITNEESYEGDYAAQSGDIDDFETSTLEITANVLEQGEITFYRKVSSEINYDYLSFYIDGIKKGSWSGEAFWAPFSCYVSPGEHTFTWAYEKDYSESLGSDCAWVDYIKFPIIQSPLSNSDILQNNVIIYPNPASDKLSIIGLSKAIKLKVIDSKGIIQINIPDFNMNYLDISGLNTGLYFLQLTNDKGVFTHKIIKD